MQQTENFFKGVIIPMVTPFRADLSVDQEASGKILQTFIEAGAAPFVLGTTGECVSIPSSLKKTFVKQVVTFVRQRTTVFAGISTNCLADSVELGKTYADLGADVLVAHLPAFFPLTTKGMLSYFEQLANQLPRPLVLYNMPLTVKQSIPLEVIEQLSHHPNIIGIKDSEKGMERLDATLRLWAQRKDFACYIGCAAQSAYGLLQCADGIVPSAGNLIPQLYQFLYQSAIQGNVQEAQELQRITDSISEVYQQGKILSESIPALKALMAAKGLCQAYTMPPLYTTDKKEQERMWQVLQANMNQQLTHKA